MSTFVTLLKREFADNRVGMLWLPAIIAGLLLLSVGGSILFGDMNFGGARGTITFDMSDETPEDRAKAAEEIARMGPNAGVSVDGDRIVVDTRQLAQNKAGAAQVEQLREGASAVSVLLAAIASPVLIIAAFSAAFILLGSLYEERVDRSILFWKSMPVSDLTTVLSKLMAGVGITFGVALALGLLLHLSFIAIGSITAARLGLGDLVAFLRLDLIGWTWLTLIIGALMYVLWCLPFYGYLLVVSAAAPKTPFVWAIVPIVGLAIIERTLGFTNGLSEELARRISGTYIGSTFDAAQRSGGWQFKGNEFENVAQAPAYLLSSLQHPGLWIGLIAAGGLIYLASEIRRRKAL
jgi:ABC-2 type transport system permease protein